MILARKLGQAELDRAPGRAGQARSQRDHVGFQGAAGRLADRHRVKGHPTSPGSFLGASARGAGRLGCRPHFAMVAAEPHGGRQGLETKVLSWSDVIGRGEHPRPPHRRVIVAAVEPVVRVARSQCIIKQQARIGRHAGAREFGVRGVRGALGSPPAIGGDRQRIIRGRNMPDAGNCLDCFMRIAGDPPAGRRQARRCEQHSGEPDVAGEAQAAVGLGRSVQALQRLPDQPRLARQAQRRRIRWSAVRRFLGELGEGEGPDAVDDEAVGRVAVPRRDVPAVGGRADQHRPRHRGRLAHRPFERAYGGRAGSDAQALGPALLPGQGIRKGRRERRGLDADRLPRRAEFVGDDLRQRGPDALPGLGLRHRNRHPPVASNLDERAERLLARLQRQVAREAMRPQRISDDQADPDPAAD